MHRSSNTKGVSIARRSENTALDLISETPVTLFDDIEGPPERLPAEKMNIENCYLNNNNMTKAEIIADDHFPVSPVRRKKKKSVSRSCRTHSPVSVMSPFIDREITKNLLPIPSYDDEEEEYYQQPTATTTPIKKVRFFVDEYGEIDEQLSAEHSFPNYELTPELIEQCWSSKMDRKNLKASIPGECRDLITKYPEYRRAALKVCAMSSREDFTKLLEKNFDALETITNPNIRGLERPMFNRMLIPRKSYKVHVYAVLRTQELINELQNNNDTKYTYDETSALIAEQYTTNAHYMIRFAFLMGLADADAAIRD